MESLAHSEVFFIIAAIALIVVSIVLLIILGYVLYILHKGRTIVKAVQKEMIHIIDDVDGLRVAIKDKAKTVSSLLSVASGMALVKKFTSSFSDTQGDTQPQRPADDISYDYEV